MSLSVPKHPALFLEIKATGHIHKPSQCAAADLQMQDRFFNLFDEVKIPIFYELSALGPRVSVYTFNKSINELDPAPLINTGNRQTHGYGASKPVEYRHNVDRGGAAARNIIGQVKAMCSEIR